MRRLAELKGRPPVPLTAAAPRSLSTEYDYLAPDKSEIRLLMQVEEAGLAHCVLPGGKVSLPVRHRTVEELWYVLDGSGDIWRARGDEERVDSVFAGDSVWIPVGVCFQFRAAKDEDLKVLITTMPAGRDRRKRCQLLASGLQRHEDTLNALGHTSAIR